MYTFADRGDRSVTLRPEGTAGGDARRHRTRPRPWGFAGQALLLRPVLPVRASAGWALPAVAAKSVSRRSASMTRHWMPRSSQSQTRGSDRWASTASAWRSHRWATTPVARSTANYCRNSCSSSTSTRATRQRAQINPLRVLDDKRPHVREMTAEAPVMLDHLSQDAAPLRHRAVASRRARGAVRGQPRMVRGLDYYTKTTFEFVHDGLGAQSGIGGGGRYDGLMRQLGGQDLSASDSAWEWIGPCWPWRPREGQSGRRLVARCSACRWATRRNWNWQR